NLHSYEEFDLAVRLRSLGWKLWRLPVKAVTHFGHDAPPYALLMRRWRSRYACGLGELVRAASGDRRMRLVLRGARELRLYAGVLAWWAMLLAVLFWPAPAAVRAASFAALAAAPFLVMLRRKRSLQRAAYSVVSWCFNAAGLVRGLLHRRRPAQGRIESRVIQEPPPMLEPNHPHYA
ncbi:MAG: glycosyl transferase, partial [Comamonadaceae bacterium]